MGAREKNSLCQQIVEVEVEVAHLYGHGRRKYEASSAAELCQDFSYATVRQYLV